LEHNTRSDHEDGDGYPSHMFDFQQLAGIEPNGIGGHQNGDPNGDRQALGGHLKTGQ
jgi:hypothetical protein